MQISRFRQLVENVLSKTSVKALTEAKVLKLKPPKNWQGNNSVSTFTVLENPSAGEIYNFWKNSKYHDIRALQRADNGIYYWTDAYYLTHPDLIDVLYYNGYFPYIDDINTLHSDYDSIEIMADRRVSKDMLNDIPGLDKYFLLHTDDEYVLSNLAHGMKDLEKPEDIKDIENPDEYLQIQAIVEKPEVIKYIKNPTENVKALYNLLTKDEL